MEACIKDIAYYLPENILNNEELEKIFTGWDAEKVFYKVGIRARHVAAQDETAIDMAEKAALKLFERNPDLKSKVDFILLCTQSPDYIMPSSACILQDRLGISNECGAFDYNLGCSGFVYGLAAAKSFIYSGIARNILLFTSDTCTKFLHPMDKSTRTIFGDGAAVIWIGESEGESSIGEFVLGTDGSGADNLIIPAGGMRLKYSDDTRKNIVYEDGNIRSKEHLNMNGPEVFNFILARVPGIIEEVLRKNGLTKEETDYYIFHQANKYILEHLRRKIKIPQEKFYLNMEDMGNTSSSSIPIGLLETYKNGSVKKGFKVVLAGFGVGYSWGGCVIKW